MTVTTLSNDSSDGWTYFAQPEEGGLVKIGFTSHSPATRLRSMQTGSPSKLRIVGAIRGNVEKQLHLQFNRYRVHGEWFHPASEIADVVLPRSESSLIEGEWFRGEHLETHYYEGKPPSSFSPSHFDFIIHNTRHSDPSDFHRFVDWSQGKDDRFEDEDGETVDTQFVVEDVLSELVGDPMFASFGVNVTASLVGFFCGPIYSKERWETVKRVAYRIADLDQSSSNWWFYVLCQEGEIPIGIDLTRLGLQGEHDNGVVFDPRLTHVEMPSPIEVIQKHVKVYR